ncbi:MAG: serine/threonine-protein kinase, partial [Myxococcota bacterium]|nr:serine/threonine-protein kinase [Myxococcota bacterium]
MRDKDHTAEDALEAEIKSAQLEPVLAGRVLSRLFKGGHGLTVLAALEAEGVELDAKTLRSWLIELSTPLPQPAPIDPSPPQAPAEPELEELPESAFEGFIFGDIDEADDQEGERIIQKVVSARSEQTPPPRSGSQESAGRRSEIGDEVNLKAFSSPFSRYRLGVEIARGGAGKIRIADDRQLSRRVVLKVLHEDRRERKSTLRRFIDEARLTAQLEHPNIVPVHDLGLLEDGSPFFTLKLIHGQTLKRLLRGLRAGDEEFAKRYTLLKRLKIFQQLCNAVSFAHSRGVIHRDIKPSNVMVGEFGEVQLLDWGIARVVSGLGNRELAPVRGSKLGPQDEGIISGTPSYMAPEQARGVASEIGPASDIHALGATLYELLTLRPPFRGRSPEEILENVIKKKARPPSKIKGQPRFPRQIEEICLRCLEKKAEDRFPSVEALSEALNTLINLLDEGEQRRERARAYLEEG